MKGKKESILIVKPKNVQESETTKKLKERVDIKNLAVGITKLRKGGKGSVYLGVSVWER